MVKTIKLRDSTFPGQRLEKLKSGLNYRHDPATADVTLHCGATGKSIKAHTLVLASISDVLRDYLFEYEKEGNVCSCFNPTKKKGKESVSDHGIHIILEDMEWDVLKIIIDLTIFEDGKHHFRSMLSMFWHLP